MKIEKLGEDLYKVKLSPWSLHISRDLAAALLEIQDMEKVITALYYSPGIRNTYLVCTTNK